MEPDAKLVGDPLTPIANWVAPVPGPVHAGVPPLGVPPAPPVQPVVNPPDMPFVPPPPPPPAIATRLPPMVMADAAPPAPAQPVLGPPFCPHAVAEPPPTPPPPTYATNCCDAPLTLTKNVTCAPGPPRP